MSPQHVANTIAKADRIITWILEHLPTETIDLDQMRGWRDPEWQHLADLITADTGRPESIPTTSRSAIIVGLREHQQCDAGSPFDGLPS